MTPSVRRVELSDAEEILEALVDHAEQGIPTVITRSGKPVAWIVPVADADGPYPDEQPG